MNRTTRAASRCAIALFAAALAATAAHAGPPLACWNVKTAEAPSLPWSDTQKSYDATRSDYDSRRLVDDTLALLGADVPVLARMETLRRAALYSTHSRTNGQALLRALVARARAGAGKAEEGLAIFDAGYFVATWKQADYGFLSTALASVGLRSDPERSLGGSSGYDWVRRAIELESGNPAMEFAAALMTWYPLRPEHDGHLARAAAGAKSDPLLAENIRLRFPDRGLGVAAR